jgi:c-di-GMP-binding flagellar brake protein YcgR
MSEIKEDQKAKLSLKLLDNSFKELECFVKEVHSDRISLSFPREMISYANHLQEGDEIPIKIFTPSGIKMFNAMILSSPLEPEFVIEYDENFVQVQRREYTRARLETKIIIERLESENIVTHTIDIGGGGVRFFYEGTFEPNELVSCRLYLPFILESVKAQGHILQKPFLAKNEHVVLFSKINENERDKIVKKCFELETKSYKDTTV